MALPKHIVTLQRYPAGQLSQAAPSARAVAAQRAAQRRGQARVQSFVFPVNAENIEIRQGRDTVDVAMLRNRTVSRPGNSTPIEITISGLMLPDPSCYPDGTAWLNVPASQLRDPWSTFRMLRDWQTASGGTTQPSPLRLVIADIYGMALWVTMTQCDGFARGGEPNAAYVDCAFKEIVDLPQLKAKRVNPNAGKKQLISKKGDTIVSLIKRRYGKATPNRVREVYKLNKSKIGKNRNKKLPAGVVIRFPAVDPK